MGINTLTSEIAKRILLNIGASPSPDYFGKVGLTENNFIIDKKISIAYDNSGQKPIEKHHPIYSGRMKLGSSILRGMLADLTYDYMAEFLFLFRMDANPVYAVKWFSDDEEIGFIKYFDSKKEAWINTSMLMQATLLVNFEKITSWGILWENSKEIDDIYKLALQLI